MKILVTSIVSRLNAIHSSLTQGEEYLVVEINNDSYRIVNDAGEPVLYPKCFFMETELQPPADWVRLDFDEGEYAFVPKELSSKTFFENWFDYKLEEREAFENYLRSQNPE